MGSACMGSQQQMVRQPPSEIQQPFQEPQEHRMPLPEPRESMLSISRESLNLDDVRIRVLHPRETETQERREDHLNYHQPTQDRIFEETSSHMSLFRSLPTTEDDSNEGVISVQVARRQIYQPEEWIVDRQSSGSSAPNMIISSELSTDEAPPASGSIIASHGPKSLSHNILQFDQSNSKTSGQIQDQSLTGEEANQRENLTMSHNPGQNPGPQDYKISKTLK